MTQHDDDRELDRYLEGGADASRRYAELGDELPPPELDAKILAAAERVAKVTPLNARRAPPFKAFAWAAIVVLSFSLVLNIVFQETVQDPARQLESMAGRANVPARDAPPASASPAAEADDVLANSKRDLALRAPAEPGVAERKERGMEILMRKRSAAEDTAPSETVATYGVEEGVSSLAQAPMLGMGSDATTMSVLAEYLAKSESEGRLDGIGGALADLKVATKADTDANIVDDADDEVHEIFELYERGSEEEALERLVKFRAANPEHPVSVELEERGL